MKISELVKENGLNIIVSCGNPTYPKFKVIKQISANEFLCRHESKKEFVLVDCLDDYKVIE